MRYLTQLIKPVIPWLFLLLLLFGVHGVAQAAGKVTLTGMEKQEQLGRTRLIFRFSALPEFEVEHSGQRVDLLLKKVWMSAKLRSLPEDETVVKILLAQKHSDMLTSILLRRPPEQVITESKQSPARIVMDLFWEKDEGARPGVAFRIAGMPPRKAGKKARQYQQASPWEGRWRQFFSDYRSTWQLDLPLQYTLPPLPPLVTNQQDPLWPLQQFAAEGKWLSLLRWTGQLSGVDAEQRYLRDLLVAEALLRSGSTESALALLQQLAQTAGAQQLRVDYLTACGQALGGQPFLALLTLQDLLPALPGTPLAASGNLLAAETALSAGKYQQALAYFENAELDWPLQLLAVVDLRRADAEAGLGQLKNAVLTYRELAGEPGLFDRYLSSANRAAQSAYQLGDFGLSYQLYRQLTGQVKELPGADLVQFAAGAAAYAAGNLDWGIIGLQKASLDWPAQEGGERAELRLIDHQLITGGDLELARAVGEYARLGQQANSRMVREEATFKQALAQYLLTDYQESIAGLMRFRREFRSSELRREADLLLLKQLPTVVHSLLQQHRELEAVVLVEQNRNLLLRGGLEREFLNDLASAFDNLGLYARAGRVLLYLFDKASSEADRSPLYLPLARSYLKRGEFANASDYAGRYLEKHPRGEDSGAVFGVLLDAFEKQGRDAELLAWLKRKDRPSSPALEIRAAWIYWRLEQPERVVSSLEQARRAAGELEVKEMALLAESHYQLRQNNAAEKIYRQLTEDPQHGAQARYRRAQLLLRRDQRQEALNLLGRLVDEDADSSWKKLAQDLLIQQNTRNF